MSLPHNMGKKTILYTIVVGMHQCGSGMSVWRSLLAVAVYQATLSSCLYYMYFITSNNYLYNFFVIKIYR